MREFFHFSVRFFAVIELYLLVVLMQMKQCQKMQYKYEVIILNEDRHQTLTSFIGRLPNTLPEESLYPTSLKNEPTQDV